MPSPATPTSPVTMGSSRGMIKVWNYEKKKDLFSRVFEKGLGVQSLSYNPEGTALEQATLCSLACRARERWRARRGVELHHSQRPFPGDQGTLRAVPLDSGLSSSLAISGGLLGIGFTDGMVLILDSMSLEDQIPEPFRYSRVGVTHITFS